MYVKKEFIFCRLICINASLFPSIPSVIFPEVVYFGIESFYILAFILVFRLMRIFLFSSEEMCYNFADLPCNQRMYLLHQEFRFSCRCPTCSLVGDQLEQSDIARVFDRSSFQTIWSTSICSVFR